MEDHTALALAWLHVPPSRFQEILVSKAQGVLFGSRQGGTRQSHAITKMPCFNRRGRRCGPWTNIYHSNPIRHSAAYLGLPPRCPGCCNLTFHLITWGEHPRPTSRPADCPRMMGLVGWCGSNATIGNKGVCQLAAGDRRPGLLLYSNSVSSTTVRSVHYTCDPSSVFGAWHGDSHPPKGQTRAKVRLASFLQPAVPDLETLLQRSWNAWYWRPGGMICVSESPCPHASGCLKANLGIVGDQIWCLAGWQILTN